MLDRNEGFKPSQIDVEMKTRAEAKTPQQLRQEFDAMQTLAQVIENDIQANIVSVEIVRDLPQAAVQRDQTKMDSLRLPGGIVEVVQQTLAAIKLDPNNPKLPLPANTSRFLTNLSVRIGDVWKINERNAPLLNRVIRLALQDRLNTPDELVFAFESIKALEFIDGGNKELFFKIAEGLQQEADIKILDPVVKKTTLDRLTTPELREFAKKEMQKTAFELKKAEIGTSLKENITLGQQIIDQMQIGNVASADEAAKIKLDLKMRFNYILNGRQVNPPRPLKDMTPEEAAAWRREDGLRLNTAEEIGANVRVFQTTLSKYLQNIDNTDFKELHTIVQEFRDKAGDYVRYAEIESRRSGAELLESAKRIIPQIESSPEKMQLLGAITDVSKFQELIHERYQDFRDDPEINYWDLFVTDVRGLFDTLYENAELSPKDFWDRSFNEFYEGNLYRQLINTLRGLGEQVGGVTNLATKQVQVKDLYAENEKFHTEQSDLIALPTLTQSKLMRMDLGTAIRIALTNEMIDYKDLTEFSHNVNALTQLGLGFDKLAEYSQRLRMQDIDRLLHSTTGLSEVYNLYLENILMSLSLNNHIFPVDFGRPGIDNLDPVEQMTYQQFAAYFGKESSGNPEILRLIRKASALTKGVFGEYWGTVWTAIMNQDPILKVTQVVRKERQADGTVVERTVNKYSYNNGASFKSNGSREIEKILTSIDLDLTLKRFGGIPKPFPDIRNSFIPRDYHHPPPEFYWYTHADIYEYGNERDEATIAGRSDKLIAFDDKYEFASENFRSSTIDYALRGGWRYYDYHRFLVYKYKYRDDGTIIVNPTNQKPEYQKEPNGKIVVDFDATMRQIAGVGPYITKTFIDALFDSKPPDFISDIEDLKLEKLAAGMIAANEHFIREASHTNHHWHAGNKLDGHQKTALKQLFYEKYLLEPLMKTRPTHFITMEQRRWIPRDEVEEGRTTRDRLYHKLTEMYPDLDKSIISTHLLPLYIGALQLAEFEEQSAHEKEWKKNRVQGDYYPGADYRNRNTLGNSQNPMDYTFEAVMIDSGPERKKKILNFYHQRLDFIGKIEEPIRSRVELSDENFFDRLKEFYGVLRSSLDEDRWHENRYQIVKDVYELKNNNLLINRLGEGGIKETLPARYARMLINNQGNVEYYLKGNLTNMKELYFSTAGVRGPERMLGETMGFAQTVTKNLQKVYTDNLDALIRKKYPDIHQWEEAVKELVGKPFDELGQAITNIDYDQSMGFIKKHAGFILGLIREDRVYSLGGIGPLVGDFQRRWHKGETGTSYMTDQFPSSVKAPSTAANSEQQETFLHTVAETVGMKRTEKNVIKQEPFTIFGMEIPGISDKLKGNPVFGADNKHFTEQMIHAFGVSTKQQIMEKIWIIGPAILFAIFLLMAKLAADKDKKH